MLELQGCITENHWTSLKIKRLNCSQLTSPRIHEGQCKSLVLRFFVFKAYASLIYGSGKKCPHLKVHLWLYVFVDIRYRRYVAGALALGFSLQALRHCGFSFFFHHDFVILCACCCPTDRQAVRSIIGCSYILQTYQTRWKRAGGSTGTSDVL